MRLDGRNKGCIDYRVSGKLAGQAINVRVNATFEFNQVTGVVVKHTQEIDVTRYGTCLTLSTFVLCPCR